MADEQKTLLKFEGDASGVAQAAEQVKQAIEQTSQKAAQSGQQISDQNKATTQALQTLGESAGQGADGMKDLTEGTEQSERAARQFLQVLGRINPELAAILQIAAKGSSIAGYLFSPMGVAATTAAAAITYVAKAMDQAAEAAEKFAASQKKFAWAAWTSDKASVSNWPRRARANGPPMTRLSN